MYRVSKMENKLHYVPIHLNIIRYKPYYCLLKIMFNLDVYQENKRKSDV